MRTLHVATLLALASACAREPEITPATDHAALAAGAEAPCGTAQVFFDSGSLELDETSRARLDEYAACIDGHGTDVVYVTGMSDPAGSEDDNLTLGRARALVVAEHLRAHGVEAPFTVRSLGEEGALESPPLWPVERSVEVTGVDTH
jgi:outer membrane protein OmpA-like peptidoglycan-associated protein